MLRADCARCQGLCCVFLAFDRSEWFAFDKPAGVACRHLRSDQRCAVHDSLAGRGFSGCAAYDCYGAGQRASQLLPDAEWRIDLRARQRAMQVFATLRELHELWFLLQESARLELPREPSNAACELTGEVAALAESEVAELCQLDCGPLRQRVHTFLRSLRGHVARRLTLIG